MQSFKGRASIIGLGLIGGSLALALKQAGWFVAGEDRDDETTAEALERGFIDEVGIDEDSEIVFVATPVLAVPGQVRRARNVTSCPITDVGSVKAQIVSELADVPMFVAGHPMAGNEFSKLDGADPNLFSGATWILCPTGDTDERAFSSVLRLVQSVFRASAVSMDAERHDGLVAAVSHVPHLTAAALMQTATSTAGPYISTMHKVAAGGFRDMTRISSGDPDIWVDIAVQNKNGIDSVLSDLIATLTHMRTIVRDGDSNVLRQVLVEAQSSRRNLPVRVIAKFAEVRVPVEDRVGALKEVTNLATDLDVNLFDFEIAHNAEGDNGTLILVVEESAADRLYGGLRARDFRPLVTKVGPSGL